MTKKTESAGAPDSPYIRGQAAAARYGQVSKRTISEWQARKILTFLKPSRKIVLFRKADIDALLGRYEVRAV